MQWLHHFFQLTVASQASLDPIFFVKVAALITVVGPALRAVIDCVNFFVGSLADLPDG